MRLIQYYHDLKDTCFIFVIWLCLANQWYVWEGKFEICQFQSAVQFGDSVTVLVAYLHLCRIVITGGEVDFSEASINEHRILLKSVSNVN